MNNKIPLSIKTDDSQIDPLLNAELKAAKIKAAVLSVILGIILFSLFTGSPDSHMKDGEHILTALLISSVLTLIAYPFAFRFWSGKKIIRKLKNMKIIPENDSFEQPEIDLMMETNNALNGYGPVDIGFIATRNIHDD